MPSFEVRRGGDFQTMREVCQSTGLPIQLHAPAVPPRQPSRHRLDLDADIDPFVVAPASAYQAEEARGNQHHVSDIASEQQGSDE